MAQNAMIGWQNLLSGAALSDPVGNSYTGFPPSNVALDVGGNSYAWRSKAGNSAYLNATFAAASPVQVVSLHRTNLSPSATVEVALSLNGTFVYDSGAVGGLVANGQAMIILPAPVTADRLYLTVTDPGQQQAYLTIALAYCGPVFQPTRNFTMDGTWGSTPKVDGFTSRSGVNFPQYRYRMRTLKLPWQNFLPSEIPTVEAIVAFADTARNLLVIPQPDTPTTGPLPLFGQGSFADRQLIQGGYRGTTLTLTERL